MTNYIQQRAWSDRFLPAMKRILGEHLIGEAPKEEDMCRNTDLITLSMEPMRIACRIRKPKYIKHNDFTIRYDVSSGRKTEFQKILDGWGDYFLYGYAGENDDLSAWGLCRLDEFRRWHNAHQFMGKKFWTAKRNWRPGDSEFICVPWASMRKCFLVAQHNLPVLPAA